MKNNEDYKHLRRSLTRCEIHNVELNKGECKICNSPRFVKAVRFLFKILLKEKKELCFECGCPVDALWACNPELWKRVVGYNGGVFCMHCFTNMFENVKDGNESIVWKPVIHRDLSLRETGILPESFQNDATP